MCCLVSVLACDRGATALQSVANFYEESVASMESMEMLHFQHDACRHALHGICQNLNFLTAAQCAIAKSACSASTRLSTL